MYAVQSPLKLNCNFEQDYCEYYNSPGASRAWRLGTSTLSKNTGPSKPFSGKFVYYEATNSRASFVAILESPTILLDRPICLSFVYHMFGADMGRFMVTLLTLNQDETSIIRNETLLRESSNKGDNWIRFSREITDVQQPSVSRELSLC